MYQTSESDLSTNVVAKAGSLPSLLNSTDVDQVMLGLELQKFQARVKEYFDNNKGVDESDKVEVDGISEKLEVGLKNAAQGEMGYPFAQGKINDVKKSLDVLKNNIVEQTEESLKIYADVKNHD